MSGNSDWCNHNQHTACRYDHCTCICHLDALIDFGAALATERRQRQASLATVSRESGVPQWSIQRIERGAPYTSTTALKLLGWMDTPDPDSTCDRCGIRGHGLMCRDCRDVIRDEEGHG